MGQLGGAVFVFRVMSGSYEDYLVQLVPELVEQFHERIVDHEGDGHVQANAA